MLKRLKCSILFIMENSFLLVISLNSYSNCELDSDLIVYFLIPIRYLSLIDLNKNVSFLICKSRNGIKNNKFEIYCFLFNFFLGGARIRGPTLFFLRAYARKYAPPVIYCFSPPLETSGLLHLQCIADVQIYRNKTADICPSSKF